MSPSLQRCPFTPVHFDPRKGMQWENTVHWKATKDSIILNQKEANPASKVEAMLTIEEMPRTV